MKTEIKNIYLIIVLSLSIISAHAAEPRASKNSSIQNPLGTYQCERIDPGHNTKSYPLTVRKSGTTYAFEWIDSKGDPVFYGTGIISPNLPNFITTSFWNPYKPEIVGVEVFEIKPDGSLQGDWVFQAEKELGSETCIKNNP